MKQKMILLTITSSLGLMLIGMVLMSTSPQTVQARTEPPQTPNEMQQLACDLLDQAQTRSLMSGALETKLLIQCGLLEIPEMQPSGLLELIFGPTQTNVLVNDPTTDVGLSTTQSETSIAVNPNNGTICSAHNDSQHWANGGIAFAGFSSSTDDGATFTDHGPIPAGGGGNSFGDPSLVWRQSDGKFYYASLHSNGLSLWRSDDDCTTMIYVSMIHTGGGDDKEMMAVDNNPASPYYGRLYVAWTDFAAGSQIYVTYSDDTTTWSTPVAVSTPATDVQGAWPSVDPNNGDIYVAWVRWNPYYTGTIDIEIVRSTNGGVSFAPVTNPLTGAVNPYDNTATSNCTRPALHANVGDGIRYLPSPQIAVGPDGALHVVYSKDPDGNGVGDVINVYYRRSIDHGATWGPEIRLNDDGTQTDQWFPTISVGSSNVVVSTWYDRRSDVANNYLFVYYKAISYNGGVTWGSNIRVSDAYSAVPSLNPNFDPIVAYCYHGDYDQQVQHNGYVYIQWSDDRNVQNGHPDPDVWFEKEVALFEYGWLEGTIYDADTLAPIDGAFVEAVDGQNFHANSSSDGFYSMIAAPGTYEATASAFGYQPNTIPGVTILSNAVTTQDIPLSPAPTHLVEGYVTDANTGWPLYASINTNSPAGVVWTDPETGYYSVILPGYFPYIFDVAAWVPGYIPATRFIGTLTADVTENFALDATCEAPGYQPTSFLFSDDFESGYGNWTGTGLWNPEAESDTCGLLVAPFPSPSNAVYYGQDGVCTYDTGARTSGELTMVSPVTLPNAGGILEFASFENTECNGDCVWDNRYIEISKDNGATWDTLGEGDTEGTWYQKTFDLSTYRGDDVLVRFRFDSMDDGVNGYFGWMVDDVSIMGCTPPPSGGLVVGNVYNESSLDPLVGAEVSNDTGEVTVAFPTPDDPAVDDAFYTLFSPDGNHVFTATYVIPYGPAVETVTVVNGDTVRQDFLLPAPNIAFEPESLEAWLITGTAVLTHPMGLDVLNNGGMNLKFRIRENQGGYTPAALNIPRTFELPSYVVPPELQGQKSAEGLNLSARITAASIAAPFAAGDVIQSWTVTEPGPWGIAYYDTNSTVWVSSPYSSWGGDDHIYEHEVDGTATGRVYNYPWAHINGPGDLTYNWNTGMLWIMNINTGVSNCIFEIDPASGYTGNSICPGGSTGFSVSQRGLAYDPVTDTYFAGSWNDLSIHHFAADGTILSSVNVGLAVSGLAYNPETMHLFVMVNDITNDVYVLDAANNYNLLGQFSIPGFTAYSGAGLEFDCDGSLWAVDQNTDTVYQVESGETTSLCVGIPWVWEEPITGTVPAEDTFNVEIMFTALYTDVVTPMPLGTYTGILKSYHNDPIAEVQSIPVTMHIVSAFVDPQTSFTSNSPVILGNNVAFTNTSTEGLPPTEYYLWDFGDGQTMQTSNANPVNHNYASPGVYTVTLTSHQTQTGVEVVYSDTVVVMGIIYLPIITKQ